MTTKAYLRVKQWRENNKQKFQEQYKRYYEKNKQKILEVKRQKHLELNPEAKPRLKARIESD